MLSRSEKGTPLPMSRSKLIASLLGPTLMALSASEALNAHIWADVHPTLTYLNGLVLFVAGLAIVRFHNRWVLDWAICITLVGWFVMAGGLLRMTFPEAPQVTDRTVFYIVTGVLFGLGLFLTVKSIGRERSDA